jgi:hypothetical protein
VSRAHRIPYSATELAFLRRNCQRNRVELHAEFVQKFRRRDVAVDHIKNLLTRNGWIRTPRWTAADTKIVAKLYPTTDTAKIAKRLGRTVTQVYAKAAGMGLEKSEAYMAELAVEEGRRLQSSGRAHRFKKGHCYGPRIQKGQHVSPATEFKKGGLPINNMPLGAERDVAGYLYTKISEMPYVPWTKNWKATHIIKWEAIHGSLNIRTHALRCLDNNRHNTDPSNWILITRGEHAVLNKIFPGRWERAPREAKDSLLALVRLRMLQYGKSKRGRYMRQRAERIKARRAAA